MLIRGWEVVFGKFFFSAKGERGVEFSLCKEGKTLGERYLQDTFRNGGMRRGGSKWGFWGFGFALVI